MSDWSVRQLIDEYRSDGQENTAPRSRGKADYTDALQGVLAAMLMDEPSPLSLQRSVRGVARTTEEALGALLNSNIRGDYSPSSATSSLPLNSSSRPSSVDTGLLGHNKPFTTDDVLSYLVGDIDSSAKSSFRALTDRSRFGPSAPSSDTKGNSVLAAANRLFDQSRYSLAADWKLGDPHSPNDTLSQTTSPLRRDSESGLDRADFALLPPALDRKPLTPLGQKDKIKASTPPEPVQTRTLIDRKKSKEIEEIAPIGESEEIPPDEPHDDLVRPPPTRMKRAKITKKAAKAKKVAAQQTRTERPQPPVLRKSKAQIPSIEKPISEEAVIAEEAHEPMAESATVVEEPEPLILDAAEPSVADDESESIDISGSAILNEVEMRAYESLKQQRSLDRDLPAERSDKKNSENQVNDLKKGKKKISKKIDKSSVTDLQTQIDQLPELVTTGNLDVASDLKVPSKSTHLSVPPEVEFDSQDSEARHVRGAFRNLQTIAAQVIQKPTSPAAWITPRPATQIENRYDGPSDPQARQPRHQQPSVQVELSADVPSIEDIAVEPESVDEGPSSIVLYTADEDANQHELTIDASAATPPPALEDPGFTPHVPSSEPAEIEMVPPKEPKRRSLPKRSAGRLSASQELVPANNAATFTQIVPARRGQQTYGIQVTHARAAAPKRKPVQIDAMQPGKLRRISICDEATAAAKEAGKIVRTASKRLRVPALKWWAGERIEYKSEDGTLGRTIATAVYRKEDDDSSTVNPKARLRRLKEPLAITAPSAEPQAEVQTLDLVNEESNLSKCKLHINLSTNQTGWNTMKPRAVPALGVNRKNVVIRRADVPHGWDLYKKNDMCFSANVLLQNACFASVLIRLPPSETNGVDMSKDTHMLVEFVSGATLLVLMSRESASTVEQGEIVGDRKGVELSRAGSKVMIPPKYRYQFKNVSETEESLLITHVVTENKQSFFSK